MTSLPVLQGHFRFSNVTFGTPIFPARCLSRPMPNLVAMGRFQDQIWPHFLVCMVTSGLVTSLPVSLYSPLCVTVGLCQVWWQWENFPVSEGQLPVRRGHFRFHDVTFDTTMFFAMCRSKVMPSLVAIGRLQDQKWPYFLFWGHFRFSDITSGTFLFLPRCHSTYVPSLVVSKYLISRSRWQMDNLKNNTIVISRMSSCGDLNDLHPRSVIKNDTWTMFHFSLPLVHLYFVREGGSDSLCRHYP